jgi:hypothetical protein
MSSKKSQKYIRKSRNTRLEGSGNNWAQVAAVAVGAVGVGALVHYLKNGAGSDKNAVLIPDVIEDPLDKLVDALNRRYGKQWGDQVVSVLESGLEQMLPPAVLSLVKIAHRVELMCKEGQIKPSEKKRQAQIRIEKMLQN